jgi:hypothetical protein
MDGDTIRGVAHNMHDMFSLHADTQAVKVVDSAFDLLDRCDWASWHADGADRNAQDFDTWLGGRSPLEGWADPGCMKDFSLHVQVSALSQAMLNVTVGMARAALITLHGFFAQGRATYRSTVEECLYIYMIIRDPEHGRQYLSDAKALWEASRNLRSEWSKWIVKPETHDQVPNFGLTFHRLYQNHIHSGSHGGFEQSIHRTRGTAQAFVDENAQEYLGAYAVAFTSSVLQLIDDLAPLHPRMDKESWARGRARFQRAALPCLAVLNPVR